MIKLSKGKPVPSPTIRWQHCVVWAPVLGATLQGALVGLSGHFSQPNMLRPGTPQPLPPSQELPVEGSAHTQCRHPLYLRIWLYLAKRSDRQGAPVLIWKKTEAEFACCGHPISVGILGRTGCHRERQFLQEGL